MKMKPLVSSVLLIVISVCALIPLSHADPFNATVWFDCGNGEYRNGSAFNQNLNTLLESLVRNVNPSGFNTSSIVVNGQNSNTTVYGLVQCRGDLKPSDCKHCASIAKKDIVVQCGQNTSALIQLDGCFLRYDSHSFNSNYSNVYNGKNNSVCCSDITNLPRHFMDVVNVLLSNITAKAKQSPERFAADSAATPNSNMGDIYSIGQCRRDLPQTICGSCLTSASSKISCVTQGGASGAQFSSTNCYLRYEVYPFFNTSIIPSPPPLGQTPPVSGKRPNVLVITLGVVAATVGLISVAGLWKRNFSARLERPERFSPTKGEEDAIMLSASITNPEFVFKCHTLKEATSNFNADNQLGEGGFGAVFKGVLPDGREVAVKRLYIGSRQGHAEFLNEANLISRFQHRNLVKLLGCSVQSSERLLVYEYLQNSSLDKILFDTTSLLLDWKERYEIIVGIARGLAYLHEESEIRIIHRDIKASNILLDDKYKPKIADFGLARFLPEGQTHLSTRIAGTLGYMAPEYALRGQLTEKADVFSFGVLLLEIISGRKNQSLNQQSESLVDWTWRLYNTDRALEVMDPKLEGSYSWEEGIRVIKIGLLCTQAVAALRPPMSRAVSMLTREREELPSPTRPAFIELDRVSTHHQVIVTRQDPEKQSSSNCSSDATTSFTTPSDIHSAAADPSSGTLEPR